MLSLRHLLSFALLCVSVPHIVVAADESVAEWSLVPIPETWRRVPAGDLAPIGGYSWYRALVFIPEDWKDQPLQIHVESMDDARSTWWNGRQVGLSGTFPPRFRSGLGEPAAHDVPAESVRYGDLNTVAIRVYQDDPRPNFSVAPPVIVNRQAMQGVRVDGMWQYRPGDQPDAARAALSDFGEEDIATADARELEQRGIYRTIDDISDVDRYVTRRSGDTIPLSPPDALQSFDLSDDLQLELVVSDPVIAQPLFMTWDARGRLWVVEYRQYPDPAGLKMVSRDTFLRTVYDKVPPPPPHHDRGADRISIHEDTDGDGIPDRHSVFVEGLNLATSCAIGRGGVYVTNPPYLLFYPDADGDDVPDGDPVVLLEGFGIEDSHSVINSLRFGPDGWLYGAQGSTVSASVRRPGSDDKPVRTVGQQIWRYHPEEQRFEVFAEGGGNTFGCEINSAGHVFSGHNGGDTRGFHYVQGGYYRKGFGKHGPLSNPYAFGYFEDMQHSSVPRFTHNFVIYEDNVLPERLHGKLFGIEPLQGRVVVSAVTPDKSSFQTRDVDRPLMSSDPWFRPVDIKTGPDGLVYIADFYEQRIDHSSHYAGRIDRSSGRIYRLAPRAPSTNVDHAAFDYTELTNEELLAVLTHPIRWHRQTAQRILGDRRDRGLAATLLARIDDTSGQLALEYLWALHASGGLTDAVAVRLLGHAEPSVRAWTARLLCDARQISPEVARALADLAGREAYIEVRKQLASSARRIAPEFALPVIAQLLRYDEDAADIHQPLLLWWAVEAQVGAADAETLLRALLPDEQAWRRDLVSQHLLERMMKRYAMAGTRSDLQAAAALLRSAPDRSTAEQLLTGFEEAYRGRSLAELPDELVAAITATGGGSLSLRILQNQPDAIAAGMRQILDADGDVTQRIELVRAVGSLQTKQSQQFLTALFSDAEDNRVLEAVLVALQQSDDPQVAAVVLDRFSELGEGAQRSAQTALASRINWARQLLSALDDGRVRQDAISMPTVRRMLLHGDPELDAQINQRWEEIGGITTAQMLQEMQRVRTILDEGSGNPKAGKREYHQLCGRCHYLFDGGGQIGPDLTPFARDNVDRMLQNIINPSLEIREGFENHVLVTRDGRVLTGFVADRDSQVVVIRGVDGNNVIVPDGDIEELRAVPQSVMPEGTLRSLSDQQIRDLFAYIRSSQPVNY